MNVEEAFRDLTDRDWQTATGDEQIRYALVGVGWLTRDYVLPAIADSELCETTVLVTGSPESAEEVAAEYDVGRVIDYEQFHDGEAGDQYDAVYICTPNALHLEYAETAAELGKDVICEKPLEANGDRAERLVDACESAGVTLMTAYRMQCEPGIRRLREIIQDGAIGTPLFAHGTYGIDIIEQVGSVDQWRLQKEISGGGPLLDVGIYPLNTIRFLLDEDPVSVRAETWDTDDRFADVDVEEHCNFQLSFPSGFRADFTASFNAYRGDHFTIVGTEGKLWMDNAFDLRRDRRFHIERDGQTITLPSGGVYGIDEEWDYFANCLLTDTEPEPDGREGLLDSRIMDAVYEAAETGQSSRIESSIQ